jgi:hypothetical protein
VQDFYPTPGTASTVMYYTGINPLTGKAVYVPTDYHEKQLQRALLQYNRPDNAPLVREALHRAGRDDLIGSGKDCLVRAAGTSRPSAPRKDAARPGVAQRKGSGKPTQGNHVAKKSRGNEGRKNRHR